MASGSAMVRRRATARRDAFMCELLSLEPLDAGRADGV
jgi:hypothetical protein